LVVLAVMAAGLHTMSIAAAALDEEEPLAREADAAAERAVVPPNPAAADGLPGPALLGGIVLAFAVGVSAGEVQRRRRVVRRSAEARSRPAPEPTPSLPGRSAPPPPEPAPPAEPQPIEIAAPPPPPPPPPAVRSRGERILRFRPASAVPQPEPPDEAELGSRPTPDEIMAEPPADEVVAEPPAGEVVAEPPADEVVAEPPAGEAVAEPPADEVAAEPPADEVAAEPPADEVAAEPPAAEPAGPLAAAPELPQRDAAAPPRQVSTPLGSAPEALGPPAADEIVAVPARRFARARTWPEEAETLWTCEIAWKAGYLRSTFRAMAGPPGDGKRRSIGESPSLRWTLMTDPEPPTTEMIASVKALVSALVEAGWERVGPGTAWYAQRFIWRGSGEPGTVEVAEAIEPADPPSR
jgi:hypothetical protein